MTTDKGSYDADVLVVARSGLAVDGWVPVNHDNHVTRLFAI